MYGRREASRIRNYAVIATVILACASSALAAAPTPQLAVPSGTAAKIDVTVELTHIDARNSVTVIRQKIYNKDITKRSIGTVLTYCIFINRQSGLCNWVYRFPLGTITAIGVKQSSVFHRVALVGGTGAYRNIGGQVTSISLSSKIDRVVFNLEGF